MRDLLDSTRPRLVSETYPAGSSFGGLVIPNSELGLGSARLIRRVGLGVAPRPSSTTLGKYAREKSSWDDVLGGTPKTTRLLRFPVTLSPDFFGRE